MQRAILLHVLFIILVIFLVAFPVTAQSGRSGQGEPGIFLQHGYFLDFQKEDSSSQSITPAPSVQPILTPTVFQSQENVLGISSDNPGQSVKDLKPARPNLITLISFGVLALVGLGYSLYKSGNTSVKTF